MACTNRNPHRLPPNTIPSNCGSPLGFPNKIDLITWDKDVYDQIASSGGWRDCGDSWVYDDIGARGVLSNDIVGNASEDPVLYAMAKRRYYKQRPTYPWKLNSIYNRPYFNEMTGESNYTDGELTNLPRNKSAMMASIGIASSPFDYPNESRIDRGTVYAPRDTSTSSPTPTGTTSPTRVYSGGTTNIRTTTPISAPTDIRSTGTRKVTRTLDPIPPDIGGSPQIPESGPGSPGDIIDGYPTLPDDGGGGGGGGGGELPPMGGEEPPPEDEMMGNGEMVEKKYMGMTKKQAIIALIVLVVAYYWWKNKKKK